VGSARAVRRGRLRWWLVWGPVRSGTTLMANLVAEHARWEISDWGLAAGLTPPQSVSPATYDPRRPQRTLLAEVLASCTTGHPGPVDLVYKQANLRLPEFDALVALMGPPERNLFCLRDPAGFMRSAVKKFPDVDLQNLQEFNYVGTIQEHERIGGEVFLYHPAVTGEDYARFLRPLPLSPQARASVRYTGSSAPELATDSMWLHFHELAARAVNPAGPVVQGG
jgi:hypothetical protein